MWRLAAELCSGRLEGGSRVRMAEDSTKLRTHLVLGGARSGKTAYGLKLASDSHLEKCMIATAEAFDSEMKQRIALHRAERDEGWQVWEEPTDLVGILERISRPDRIVVIDCLTIWLSNLFLKEIDHASEVAKLAAWVKERAFPLILVSNELGMGLIPETSFGRGFRDSHGRMNQILAAVCDNVTFVVAGLPLIFKSRG
jgi:adenosylcobinamide kinase/adenosylcobinamide-phosphate guanylyltransferase